ncbi:MAG TPA: anti-sigma factor domain-containing protein, partial [Patescibacteria group bacterium]|nr:anti-sigma factor domain-containing protein [Patescibacteria group bacterium]
MKAIVAEIDKKQMIVITDKGDFIKVKRQMSVGIGDEIELKPQKINLTYRRLASMAACFLACIFLTTGVYAYYTPYSYVSVDINPSIALSLNRLERVIAVNPLNEDAVNLIKNTKGLKNQDIDAALSSIIESASEEGYIDEQTENQIMVVVSAKNPKQEEELAAMVTISANNQLSKVNNNYGVMVEKASVESYKEALSNKVSPGKEILADKLREVNSEIKDEEIRDMSVRDVVHLINEGRKAIKAAEKDKDKKEQPMSGKDTEKLEDKEANKDANTEKDNKNNGKPKPSAAAKDNK